VTTLSFVHRSNLGKVLKVECDGFFDEFTHTHVTAFRFPFHGFAKLVVASE